MEPPVPSELLFVTFCKSWDLFASFQLLVRTRALSPSFPLAIFSTTMAKPLMARFDSPTAPQVLWRMANQSLFAGVLEVVHKLVVVPHDQAGVGLAVLACVFQQHPSLRWSSTQSGTFGESACAGRDL